MKAPLLVTFALSGLALAESAIPTAFERERYKETFSASPFALATPEVKDVEEPKDSPLNNLVVTGLGKLDDGRAFVIVQRIGDERSMRFEGLAPNAEGIAVKQVKWGERWRQSTVVLTHKNEERSVEFNQSVTAAAPPPPPNAGNRGSSSRGPTPAINAPPPIVPGGTRAGTMPKTMSITPTIPRPGGTQVPRPGSGAQLQTNFRGSTNVQGTAGAAAPVPTNGGAPRQRIRPINNR